jgi:hypothetical protein
MENDRNRSTVGVQAEVRDHDHQSVPATAGLARPPYRTVTVVWQSRPVGWSCHWFLVRDGDPAAVVELLGGRLGTEFLTEEEATTRAAPGPTVGPLVNGWLLVTDAHWQLLADDIPVRLSRGGHVLELAVEEHVMYCGASSWRDGRRDWSSTFDANDGPGYAVSIGDLPLAAHVESDAPGVDGFDVPVDLIDRMTGWRYDVSDEQIEGGPFIPIVGLPLAQPVRKRWWPWRGSRS